MGMFKSGSQGPTGQDLPVNQVSAMRQQGYGNNQIIQTLQRDGYTSSQIFDAISRSEMSDGGPGMNMNPQTAQLGQQLPPMGQQSMPPPMNSMPDMSMGSMPSFNPGPSSSSGMGSIPISGLQSSPEELIEAIIDEKWNELIKDINRVVEWKQKADAKLAVIDQQMNDMRLQFDKLHQAVIGKVGDYDKNILEVGTQLQAMEKVFGKVLPTFIDNVNELSAISARIKAVESVKGKKKNVKKSDEDEE